MDGKSEETDDGKELVEGLDGSTYKGVGTFDVEGSTEVTSVNTVGAFLNEYR